MEAIECIKTRRSIRKYEDKPVDRSLIEEIIDIARFAPSWKNSQSVRYIAIYDNDIRNKIAGECIMGHEGNKNKLSDENIEKIYSTQFNKTEIEYFSKVVTTADIEAQKYNLTVSTYVEKEDTAVEIDIDELNQRITEIVSRQNVLRTEIDELLKAL